MKHIQTFESYLTENLSMDAVQIHQIVGSGQSATQDFIDDNNIDSKKLVDYVIKHRNSAEVYAIRDLIKDPTSNKKLLKQFVNESLINEGSDDNVENYMFFSNLETIKRHIEMLMQLDPQEVDEILKNGHDWAEDHIATSKDDIEEVYNFFQNEVKKSGTGVVPEIKK